MNSARGPTGKANNRRNAQLKIKIKNKKKEGNVNTIS